MPLGTLPPSPQGSLASGVSADGSVVAGSGDGRVVVGDRDAGVATIRIAWLWTGSLGMTDLQTYLVAHGATGLAGWRLGRPQAVTSDGTFIVGTGVNPNGFPEAYRARIPLDHTIGTSYCTPAVPNSTGQPGVIHASPGRGCPGRPRGSERTPCCRPSGSTRGGRAAGRGQRA